MLCITDDASLTHHATSHRTEDLVLMKWGYKRSREFARRLPSYRGEVAARHPVFPANSKAAAGARSGPVPVSAPDLEYTSEDDRILEDYIRQAVGTAWHSVSSFHKPDLYHSPLTIVVVITQLGTCAMKKREDGGVVDSRLNVYGVEGLKIAGACSVRLMNSGSLTGDLDMSICPSNVAAVCRILFNEAENS